ncbi:Uncharacterized membrane protein YpjA [Lentibacillus persicus]|uniref:Uncharacterized membrane protein YpjA n=1 Tax=Lentibacillus persicus TaxID=640948 RepID=A0A1I2AQT6_9BACI|nr:DUF1405 domain-containing protein [Lentibacillus persicus]SFE46089.1 Uncharacterized membrane protein YpjA [Lentibacillus persicus]
MIKYLLMDKRVIGLLFIINFIGTIYGYYWYRNQLAQTPDIFLLFVPDSPTASLFFTIVLLFFLFNKNIPYIEALAVVTLFKYGVWAVVMNILTLVIEGELGWTGYMLMISHGAMAVQGLLYTPFYAIKVRHLVLAAIWTLHNDVIDYVFEQMPVYSSVTAYMNEVGYFTFWLSILSVGLAYVFTVRRKN